MLIKKFENQVKKNPHRVAIKTGEKSWTYNELNRYANRIAQTINNKRSANPGSKRVGLLFENAIDMIAAIIAVLKTGNVYVPLSPDYPTNRLNYILTHARVSMIITGTQYRDIVLTLSPSSVISLLNVEEIDPLISTENVKRKPRENRIAYILYTSGTTGNPKGVMQTHKNVLHFIDCYTKNIAITPGERMTLFSSFSHDAAVMDIYGALLNGARLYPLDIRAQQSLSSLSLWLNQERITIWHSVPTLYRYFVKTCKPGETFPWLRFIVLGGEPVVKNDINVFKEKFSHTVLYNLYGQTESSYNSGAFIHHQTEVEIITLGQEVEETKMYLMDEQGNEVEPLETGEIIIASQYISPGYWKDKEAGKKSFQDNPGLGKLYRTGDLGYLHLDGSIEYIGRKDTQVKIRGHRVELGEIETLLSKHNQVKEVVVTAVRGAPAPGKTGDEEKYLTAYMVTEKEIDPTELREFLALWLPGYMIPSFFVNMQLMPLTTSGKIDRKALPAPGTGKPGITHIPPGNENEKKLAEIWAEVLDLDKQSISINVNFFEIGGHSLKAAIMAAKIFKILDVEIPLQEIFKTPTIKGLAEYIKKTGKSRFTSIELVEKREYYPLSPAQKRLYFLYRMNTHSIGYNRPLVFPLGKAVEINKLEITIKKLIARHESLRTSFALVNTTPMQRIHEPGAVDFSLDYYETDETGAKEIFHQYIKPFDMHQAPLIRSGLIKHPDGNHTLIVDMHHIISDGTSQMILTRDFQVLYQGRELEPLRLQYKDFSQWQNRLYTSKKIKAQQQYWQELYQGEIPRLHLPAGHKRPRVFTFAGKRYRFKLQREEAEKFNRLGSRSGATLYMNMLAVLNTLFYKYSGQTDIIIGAAIAGRRHVDLQHIIGMFVNTLAMRNYPHGTKTYETFLKEVIHSSINAFENQDVQFEDLVDQLNLERDPSWNPIFDISMLVQNFSPPGAARRISSKNTPPRTEPTPGTGKNPHTLGYMNTTAKFDMTFYIYEQPGDIYIDIEYYAAIFKPAYVKRLASHFRNIISAVNRQPASKLKDIDMISEAEKQQVMNEFNRTAEDYPKNKTIHQLFLEQSQKTPDNIAAVGTAHSQGASRNRSINKMQLTYKEINKKSGQMAAILREKDICPQVIVGIMVGPYLEMLQGILGILKAGGAFLSIDPDHPEERIKYMLTHSGAQMVLTLSTMAKKMEKEIETLFIDREEFSRVPSTSFTPGPRHRESASGRCLAYIIYTSGTTGKPRGVMVEHAGLVNLCWWQNRYFNTRKSDHATQYASPGFDAIIWEIFPYIVKGAALHIISRAIKLDIEKLNEYYERNDITIAFLPTQICQQFMKQENHSLRILLTGGDKLHTFVKQRYMLYNNYGPTENTVVTTCFLVSDIRPNIPIGNPIYNTRVYILDAAGSLLQPPGLAGELCIAGDGLARGYVGLPELTQQKFINNLVNKGERVYRTGDLACWQPDGKIQFLGRNDRQVKIRGSRVELAEIESQLLKHEKINEAVVIVQGAAEEKYLCAYIVPTSSGILNTSGLCEYLSGELPHYMIPNYFVQVESIPLTANGKVDQKKLPAIEGDRPELKATYVAPHTELEKLIANTWMEVLGLKKVGLHDNFFELGGNSLKLMQLNTTLKETLQEDIPMVELFKYQTIHAFITYLEPAQAGVNQLPGIEARSALIKRAKRKQEIQKTRRRRK